ncbi:hypothetical protein IPU79_10870 [Micrococcus luteus]|uniref:hypothetical protein n=1 Tax=Micrococcus luteus TaxID=1270 RepID=UPI001A97BF20|nr:hypothetical protein [Micrococcus luteus]MBO1029668.1 hypothetical protein [Micrococcus luteus]MCV7500488.1 hypothetical protein [Micrococcus luteus]MCV7660122.1 hypothetical protein [Micrococcus luteus]MCV7662061.1 hypothetical protein [Micrococcus luteus]
MSTTKTAPAYTTAENIRAQVHAHAEEERRDASAHGAMLNLMQKIGDGREDPEPDLNAAYEQARISGDWEEYERIFRAHDDWADRSAKRARMANNLRNRAIPNPERRRTLKGDAGRLTLTYLAGALPSILDAAQRLTLHGVPSTAEAAMTADPRARGHYLEAAAVVDAYRALRRAQAAAVTDINATVAESFGGPSKVSSQSVLTIGQFRDALHLDATWLSNRRNAIGQLRSSATRAHLRRYVPGIVEFLDDAPAELFGPITADGFPAECTTVPARAQWLATWSTRLDFWVPEFEDLQQLQHLYGAAINPGHWQDRKGLVLANTYEGESAADNAERLALVNLDYRRPDWDTPQPEPTAEDLDAITANRAALPREQHPGLHA